MLEIEVLNALGYEINNRKYSEVKKLFSEDYRQRIPNCIDDSWVYGGAEHKQVPKLPNVTVLPHIFSGKKIILGTTFGHTHIAEEQDNRQFQEIYEFKGFGGMLTYDAAQHSSEASEATLHVLRPGEKIGVTPYENMTLFNLSQKPLFTLDYANVSQNRAHKDTENTLGSLLLIECLPQYTPRREANPCGMILTPYEESLEVQLNINHEYVKNKIITAPSEPSITLLGVELGEKLYSALYESQTEIRDKTGLRLSFGGNLPQFSKPLLDYVLNRDKEFFGALGMA